MNTGDENTKVARNFNQLYEKIDSGISLLQPKNTRTMSKIN